MDPMKNRSGTSINSVYPDLYHACMQEGQRVPSRNGDTMELNPAVFQLGQPRRRLVTCYGRPVNVAFALAEVLWILQGRKDVAMLKFYNSRIDQWSDDGLSFNAPYGHRLRETHGSDQIEDVIRTLQKDPGSRQAVLSVWHVPSDRGWVERPTASGIVEGRDEWEQHVTADRACNVLCMMKIRDGKLNWTQVVRSNDLIWGVPYNVMQWTHVQEYIASRVGVEVGHYVHLADSLHVYDFNKPEDEVAGFDLYNLVGWDHAKMSTGQVVETTVRGIEVEIRESNASWEQLHDLILSNEDTIGTYWRDVLTLLLAHRCYKNGEDEACFDLLSVYGKEPVYSLAQARFYYHNRWRKGGQIGEPDLRDFAGLVSNMDPPEGPDLMDKLMGWFGK